MTRKDKQVAVIYLFVLSVISFVKLTILYFASNYIVEFIFDYNHMSGNELVYGGSIPWFFPLISKIGVIVLLAIYVCFIVYIIRKTQFDNGAKLCIILLCPFITINYIGNIVLTVLICYIYISKYEGDTSKEDSFFSDKTDKTDDNVIKQKLKIIAFVLGLWVLMILTINLPISNYEYLSDDKKEILEALTDTTTTTATTTTTTTEATTESSVEVPTANEQSKPEMSLDIENVKKSIDQFNELPLLTDENGGETYRKHNIETNTWEQSSLYKMYDLEWDDNWFLQDEGCYLTSSVITCSDGGKMFNISAEIYTKEDTPSPDIYELQYAISGVDLTDSILNETLQKILKVLYGNEGEQIVNELISQIPREKGQSYSTVTNAGNIVEIKLKEKENNFYRVYIYNKKFASEE